MFSSTRVTTERNDLEKPTLLGHKLQPLACLTQTLPTRTLLLQPHQANSAQLFLPPPEKGLSAQTSSSCKPSPIPRAEDCFLLDHSCAVNPSAAHSHCCVKSASLPSPLRHFSSPSPASSCKTAVYSPIHCTSLL